MAQSQSEPEKSRFTDVVSFIHAVEDLKPGDGEVKLKYSLFDARHLFIARKTGLGKLYLTVVDTEESVPLSVQLVDVADADSGEVVREIVGDAVEVFLALKFDDRETPVLDVETVVE